ncbi:MAG: oligosaccharide flippase family protein [Nocardioidaceae bacterium]
MLSWVPVGVARTAGVNLGSTVVAAATGLILARLLGAYARGGYAAVNAWFGAALVLGELGLTGATTYFVAREPERAHSYVATARRLFLVQGAVTTLILLAVAPILGGGATRQTAAFMVLFAVVPVQFLVGLYTFALQAMSIPLWNAVRLSQPVIYALLIAGLWLTGSVTLLSAVLMLAVSMTAPLAISWALYRSLHVPSGHWNRTLVRPLLTYGTSTLAATAPTLVNVRLDQIVLSVAVPRAELGQYALAVSISAFSFPISAAFGYIAMPQLARLRATVGDERARIIRRAIRGSTAVATLTAIPILAAAWLLTGPVFGPQYSRVPSLVLVLTPGAVFLAVKQVSGDVLRGLGQPRAVARCEGAAAVVTVLGLAASLPLWGTYGAAGTSVVSYAVACLLLLRALKRAENAEPGTVPVATEPPTPIDPDPDVFAAIPDRLVGRRTQESD